MQRIFTPPDLQIYNRFQNLATVAFLLGSLLCADVCHGQTLKLRFPFDDGAGTTTASDTSGGGANVTLQMVNGAGVNTDFHGAAGSGVASLSKALDFTSNTVQPGNTGPLASAVNQPNLGFGLVSSFTASVWFKPDSLQAAQTSLGPRIFILGTNGVTDDGNATLNSIALKYQNPNRMHFRINAANPTVNIVFPDSVPTNVWLFLAVTYDGANATVYLGSEGTAASVIATAAAAAQTVDFGTSGSVMIGNRVSNRQRSFDGGIDDFRFYTGAGDSNFVETVRLASAPLTIGNLSPRTFSSDYKLLQPTNTLSFTASSTDGIEASGVQLVLNGNNVSSGVVLSGSATSRTVTYTNLELNKIYNGYLRVANTNGVTGGAWLFLIPSARSQPSKWRIMISPMVCSWTTPF